MDKVKAKKLIDGLIGRQKLFMELSDIFDLAVKTESEIVGLKERRMKEMEKVETLVNRQAELKEELADLGAKFVTEKALMKDVLGMERRKMVAEIASFERDLESAKRAMAHLEADSDGMVKAYKKRLDGLVAACEKEEARLAQAKADYEKFKKGL